jgi:hypothetical protein
VVLSGSATVRAADANARAQAGEALVLPARTGLEVTLAPDASGALDALEVEVLAEALLRWVPAELDLAAELAPPALRARGLGHAALVSLIAFCESLAAPAIHPWTLEHLLAGVLLALALESGEDPARQERAQAHLDLTLAVRQLVRGRPELEWSVEFAAVETPEDAWARCSTTARAARATPRPAWAAGRARRPRPASASARAARSTPSPRWAARSSR